MTTATVQIPRDGKDRPLIVPLDGGKPVPYLRTSSFGEVLENTYTLEQWRMRKAVHGLTRRPDLYLTATTLDPDGDRVTKARFKALMQEAIDHAGGSVKSKLGTALHGVTERVDRGEDIDTVLADVPAAYHLDITEYARVTARYEMVHVEQFMVCDELQAAGTPDRLVSVLDPTDPLWSADGTLRIGDLKTGGNPNYLDKHAVQLAIYAHSELYNPTTGERTPVAVEQDFGLIFHAPAGEGRCDLYRLDLEAGWEGALLAADVRAWRKRRGICTRIV